MGGAKGSARNSSVERDHNSRLALRIANPSIHLIGKAQVLHESWRTYAPVRSLTWSYQRFLFLVMYILRTHLLENPDVVFYYKGTDKEHGVPFALNTIVAFNKDEAKKIQTLDDTLFLCQQLNKDKTTLREYGFEEFVIIVI